MSDHHDDLPRFCHPVSTKLLFGVFISLIILTVLTVVTSGLPMPPAFGFPLAMMIATAKAFLVCAFFMHMWWDKSFNVMAFLSSLFFVALFIGMTMMDTGHYQEQIDLFPRDPAKGVVQPMEINT